LRQTYNGLEVANANLNINLTSDNRVINVGGGFVAGLNGRVNASIAAAPAVTAVQALRGAASRLGLTIANPPVVATVDGGAAGHMALHARGLALDRIPAHLQYLATPQGIKLAWNMVLRTPDGDHWYDANVAADDGALVAASDWVDPASYNVFAMPTENPDDGPRTILVNPNDATASPYGWHDTNGVAGAEFTDTRGNN